ncbi:hypothetical protein DFH11DRAFT_1054985 [Phellopilus nigrolimitatus]|nr:hypothetical protein DFH11DRAFT_1054985 [Phellopilus nigrolimitatus]
MSCYFASLHSQHLYMKYRPCKSRYIRVISNRGRRGLFSNSQLLVSRSRAVHDQSAIFNSRVTHVLLKGFGRRPRIRDVPKYVQLNLRYQVLSIRHAAPPVGKLHFQAPTAPLNMPTDGVQMADTQPLGCPQAG